MGDPERRRRGGFRPAARWLPGRGSPRPTREQGGSAALPAPHQVSLPAPRCPPPTSPFLRLGRRLGGSPARPGRPPAPGALPPLPLREPPPPRAPRRRRLPLTALRPVPARLRLRPPPAAGQRQRQAGPPGLGGAPRAAQPPQGRANAGHVPAAPLPSPPSPLCPPLPSRPRPAPSRYPPLPPPPRRLSGPGAPVGSASLASPGGQEQLGRGSAMAKPSPSGPREAARLAGRLLSAQGFRWYDYGNGSDRSGITKLFRWRIPAVGCLSAVFLYG